MGTADPPGRGDPAVDGRLAGIVRLPLPAAEHRQRARLGDPVPLSRRSLLERARRDRGRAGEAPTGLAAGAGAGVAVRPGCAHLPYPGPVPDSAGLGPMDRRLTEPAERGD